MIDIEVRPEELEVMLENLRPEGVMYTINANSQEDAEDLLRIASSYRKKVFW